MCNKTLNKKDETQVNIKDLDATIMFSTNVMKEQTENNKQINCFMKIFIRKPITICKYINFLSLSYFP